MSATRSSRSRGKVGDVESGNAEDQASDLATASHYLNARAGIKRKLETCITVHNNPKKRRRVTDANGETVQLHSHKETVSDLQDVYCWECHKECVEGSLDCVRCPRTFHPVCAGKTGTDVEAEWTCPVCLRVEAAESEGTRSWAMSLVTKPQLTLMLDFALNRMRHSDSEPFSRPVPASLVPEYYDIIFHPLDLSTLQRRVKNKEYSSTTGFLEDAKWILHNSIIFNGTSTKYCNDARLIIKICRHEMAEIELCPDCYRHSVLRQDNWFSEPCSQPHCLVWAKLKGFPYWPAKALRMSTDKKVVDVRFFGAHDRAWIPAHVCFVLSPDPPIMAKNMRKHGLDSSMDELRDHIRLLKKKMGTFLYAPPKVELKEEYLVTCPLFGGEAYEAMKEAANDVAHSDNDGASSEVGSTVSGVARPGAASSPASSSVSGELTRPAASQQSDKIKTPPPQPGTSEEADADSPLKAINASDRDLSVALPSEESLGLLERIQSTINEAESSTERTTPPTARKSISNSNASTSLPSLFNTRLQPEARKRNLDFLVGRIRERPKNQTDDRSVSNSPAPPSDSQAPPKKTGVVITHERMPPKYFSSHLGDDDKPLAPKATVQNGSTGIEAKAASFSQAQVTAIFQRHTEKITSSLATALKDMWSEALSLAGTSAPAPVADSAALQSQLRQVRWAQSAAIAGLRKEMSVTALETEKRAEREREAHQEETRRRMEEEKQRAINETKRKQWCANCGKEAVFYCCWNTSYCDYPCQQQHWPKHQIQNNGGASRGGSRSLGRPAPSGPNPTTHHHAILPKPAELGTGGTYGMRPPIATPPQSRGRPFHL